MHTMRISRVVAFLSAGILAACSVVWGFDDLSHGGLADAGAGAEGAAAGSEDRDAAGNGNVADGGCTVPNGQVCTTFPLCGCAAGQNCVVKDSKLTCLDAGARQLNESCNLGAANDCAAGLICVHAIGRSVGLCAAYCSVPTDCPKRLNTWNCSPLNQDLSVNVCQARCDPRDVQICQPEGKCFVETPYRADGPTTCLRSGSGIGPGACTSGADDDCAPGYTCTSPGDCRKWCQVNGGDCGGKTCNRFAAGAAPTAGTTEFGVCAF